MEQFDITNDKRFDRLCEMLAEPVVINELAAMPAQPPAQAAAAQMSAPQNGIVQQVQNTVKATGQGTDANDLEDIGSSRANALRSAQQDLANKLAPMLTQELHRQISPASLVGAVQTICQSGQYGPNHSGPQTCTINVNENQYSQIKARINMMANSNRQASTQTGGFLAQ